MALTVHSKGQWNKDKRVRSKKKRVRKIARKKQRKTKRVKGKVRNKSAIRHAPIGYFLLSLSIAYSLAS